MKVILYVICVSVAFSVVLSCRGVHDAEHRRDVNIDKAKSVSSPSLTPKISAEEAVNIAKKDFVNAIGPLDDFEIVQSQQADGWRIEFKVKDKTANGGTAIYIINKDTGKISNVIVHQ